MKRDKTAPSTSDNFTIPPADREFIQINLVQAVVNTPLRFVPNF